MSTFGIENANVWARLSNLAAFGVGVDVGLFTTDVEWLSRGIDPDKLGLLQMGPGLRENTPDGELVELPFHDDLLIDLHVRRTARLLRIPPGEMVDDPEVVVEGTFDDEHPSEWVDELFREMRGLLAVAPSGWDDSFGSLAGWMDTWRVGVVGVARRMTSEGVGIV